jgi:hypothetical protein
MNNREKLEQLAADAQLKAEAYATATDGNASEALAEWNAAEKRCSDFLSVMRDNTGTPTDPQ